MGNFSFATHQGDREYQNDSFLVSSAGNVVGVFDGVHDKPAGGALARGVRDLFEQVSPTRLLGRSKLGIYLKRKICRTWDDALVLRFMRLANHIDRQAKGLPIDPGFTTACVAYRLRDPQDRPLTVIINIGDSRGHLQIDQEQGAHTSLLTRDHNTLQQKIDMGKISPDQAFGNELGGHANNLIPSLVGIPPDVILLRNHGDQVQIKGYFNWDTVGNSRPIKNLYWGGEKMSRTPRVKLSTRYELFRPLGPIFYVVEKTIPGRDPRLYLMTDGLYYHLGYWYKIIEAARSMKMNLQNRSWAIFPEDNPFTGCLLLQRALEASQRDTEFRERYGDAAALLKFAYGEPEINQMINEAFGSRDNATVISIPVD